MMPTPTIIAVGADDFTLDPSRSRVLRGLVSTWLKAVWAELDRVKLGDLLAADQAPAVDPT